MLYPEEISDLFSECGYEMITGVPDSIFKDFLIHVASHSTLRHILSGNEGEACSIATGYHLATGKIPIVYLQNSGLGNCMNPLTSLMDPYVYNIPALLLISWRGAPGIKDEPQHQRMGEILPGVLEQLDIPFSIVNGELSQFQQSLEEAKLHFQNHGSPFALLFPPKVLHLKKEEEAPPIGLTREEILLSLVQESGPEDIFVSTTGKTSRELYEIRKQKNQTANRDFLTVGSMGCSSAIALGLALFQPQRKIVLVDGDGACLMRMETMATIGHYQPKNLIHVLIDNEAYESTGGQKTVSSTVDFEQIAKGCGYSHATLVKNRQDFEKVLQEEIEGPRLIVVKVVSYSRSNLSRPKETPVENKQLLMNTLTMEKVS